MLPSSCLVFGHSTRKDLGETPAYHVLQSLCTIPKLVVVVGGLVIYMALNKTAEERACSLD
jgi:hypothetical protein